MRRPAVRAAMVCALIAGLRPSSRRAVAARRRTSAEAGCATRPERRSGREGGGAERPGRHAAPAPVGHLVPGWRLVSGLGSRPDARRWRRGGTSGPGGGTPGAGTPGASRAAGPYGGGPTGGPRGGGGGGSRRRRDERSGLELDIDGAERLARGVQASRSIIASRRSCPRRQSRDARALHRWSVVGDGIGTKTVAEWRGDTLEVETRGSLGAKTEPWSSTATARCSPSSRRSIWVRATSSPSPRCTIGSRVARPRAQGRCRRSRWR